MQEQYEQLLTAAKQLLSRTSKDRSGICTVYASDVEGLQKAVNAVDLDPSKLNDILN